MLLADIQQVFVEANARRMFSKDLVRALCVRSHRPWSEANRGKPITETWLAHRLRAFGLHSKDLRIAEDHAKGYEAADFTEAFDRYLPDQVLSRRDSATSPANKGEGEISKRDNFEACHGSETHESPKNIDLSRCRASEAETNASVPFMITHQMEAELRRLGHSDDEIYKMNPEQAHLVLRRASGEHELNIIEIVRALNDPSLH